MPSNSVLYPLSRLMLTRPTPWACRSRNDVVGFDDIAVVVVGGVAVGADGGEGRRRYIGRRSV